MADDEVLGLDQQAAVGGLVAALGQREDLGAAVLSAVVGGEALARLERRPVLGLHERDPGLGEGEAPRVVAVRELEPDVRRRHGTVVSPAAITGATQERRERAW